MEKQDLLGQAAKAFELIEEQKEASSRNQTEYEEALSREQQKVAQLENGNQKLIALRQLISRSSILFK